MKNLKNNIIEYIENEFEKNIISNSLIENNDKLVVAVSGGPDSMCLLDLLFRLKPLFENNYHIHYDLVVAHVNHMIRIESEDEKVYVQNFCEEREIPFYYLKENVPALSKKLKLSEETCGRKIRYDFFDQVLKDTNAQKIVTAHNANDDVETIFLNLFRGCGLNGLTGMSVEYKNIIRPLITVEKKDIMQYNIMKNLNPCIDVTNFQEINRRNKIRNSLIPQIEKEYNSNIINSILRMKEVLREDEDFLNRYTYSLVDECILEYDHTIQFDFSKILKEHVSIKKRAIREIIRRKCFNLDGISNIHILDILDLLEHNIKGKKYIIGNKFTIEIIKKNIAIIF